MAGSIIVSKSLRLPTSTWVFDYLVDRIRNELTTQPTILGKAFQPMDEGGMMFVSLAELSENEFSLFMQATARARDRAVDALPEAAYLPWWEKLLDLLSADPRVPT